MNPARILAKLVLACILSGTAAMGLAAAACQTSNGSGSLGTTVSSLALYNTQQSTMASSGIKCAGSLVSLLGTNVVTVTIANSTNKTGTQARLLNTTTNSDYVPYVICKDASCGTVYNVGSSISWSSTTLLGLLGLFNSSDGSLPLYIRSMTGARVAAGNFTDTLTLNWTWQLCDLGVGGLCLVITGSGTSTVGVSMGVVNDCILTAPNVAFGAAPLANGFADVNQVVQVACSKGAGYTVGMSNGGNWSGTVRQMKSTAGGLLQYDIYKPDGTRWGPTGTDRRSSTTADNNAGIYDGVTTQSYNYRASVIPSQTTPASGTYTDLITLDILF